jgi:hypothetical protein
MGCGKCRDGEVKRTFILNGPRAVEKRSFRLPCPECSPDEHMSGMEKLRENLARWEMTISHELDPVDVSEIGGSLEGKPSEGNGLDDAPGQTRFRL